MYALWFQRLIDGSEGADRPAHFDVVKNILYLTTEIVANFINVGNESYFCLGPPLS